MAGRPTLYSPEMLERAREYITGYEENGNAVPSVVGLASYLKVARSTLYLWADEYQEFSDTLDAIEDKQEETLWDKGLKGEYNAAIVKLMLGNHGYAEKSESDTTVKGEFKFPWADSGASSETGTPVSDT